jgi:signal transduction histidine kinase
MASPTKRALFTAFAWLRTGTLVSLLELLEVDELSSAERRRLRWFRLLCILRVIGRLAGFLLLAAMTILIASLALGFGVRIWTDVLVEIATGAVRFIGSAIFVWLYCDCLVWYLAPSTAFAFRIAQFDRETFTAAHGLSRTEAIRALAVSGALARVMFRALTKRVVNAGIRPDLADYVVRASSSLLITIPTGGPDALRRDAAIFASYSRYIRDVASLVVIEHSDLIGQVANKYPNLRTAESSEEMQRFVHPFAKRTVADAIVNFGLPTFAAIVSLVALVVSVVKP